jgi:hypothetical protein
MDFEKNPSRKGAKKWWKSRDFSLRFRIENLKKDHEHFFPKAPRQFFQKVDHFLKNPESDPKSTQGGSDEVSKIRPDFDLGRSQVTFSQFFRTLFFRKIRSRKVILGAMGVQVG